LDALATFLVAEARIIERGPEVAKKEARENVPADRVKDPSLLARELRWRVRSAAGVDSDCELGDDGNGIISIKRENSFGVGRPGKKRKDDLAPMFKNWQPPEWSTVENVPPTVLHDTITVDQGGKEVDWIAREGLSGDVMRNIKTNGIVKLRKLENGTIERYSVVRTVEYVTPSAAEMMEETM
jgi:F-box/leucine-rich repeat protein 10/11